MIRATDIHKVLLLSFTICFIAHTSQGQFVDPREAKEHFKKGNYKAAVKVYQRLLLKEKNNAGYNHKAGLCYLLSNIDKTKAVPYLERAVKQTSVDPEAYFDMGIAYTHVLRFDEAVKWFKKYKTAGKDPDKADRKLEACQTAKKLMQIPINVEFENLGKNVNSPFPDYYPFIAKDESFLAYTSRRMGNTGGVMEFDGFFSSDIWISYRNDQGVMGKAKNGGYMINSEYDESAVGLSDDANTLFIYVDKIKEYGDIYKAERGKRSFQKSVIMDETVNSPELETSASISADGNTLFFASERKNSDAQGNRDMYMTRKLPNGEWALPQNITKINTPFNEDFPTLSADGKTLYFCSEGHQSMGGYDIFKSMWDVETNSWSKPVNLGYPLNTPADERVISFSEDGVHAYISALRKEGLGDLDIWKVTFKDRLPQAIIMLKLPSGNASAPYLTEAFVTINDEYDNEIGSYMPNQSSGVYTIILAPGQYTLNIDADGYQYYSNPFVITDAEAQQGLVPKQITLTAN